MGCVWANYQDLFLPFRPFRLVTPHEKVWENPKPKMPANFMMVIGIISNFCRELPEYLFTLLGCWTKNRGVSPKIDGVYKWKTPMKLDDLVVYPYFRKHPYLGLGFVLLLRCSFLPSDSSSLCLESVWIFFHVAFHNLKLFKCPQKKLPCVNALRYDRTRVFVAVFVWRIIGFSTVFWGPALGVSR